MLSTPLLDNHVEGKIFVSHLSGCHLLEKVVDVAGPGGTLTAAAATTASFTILDDCQELWELDVHVLVDLSDHILDILAVGREPKSDQRILQFFEADGTTAISVERQKALFQLVKFVISEVEDSFSVSLYEPFPIAFVDEMQLVVGKLLVTLCLRQDVHIRKLFFKSFFQNIQFVFFANTLRAFTCYLIIVLLLKGCYRVTVDLWFQEFTTPLKLIHQFSLQLIKLSVYVRFHNLQLIFLNRFYCICISALHILKL